MKLAFIELWLAKLRLENPPIEDKNTRVCSEHFLPEDYVTNVLPGHGPSKKTMKPQAVPSRVLLRNTCKA